ncbi:hypothetical protein [Oscillatoria sp. FACHB-1407]|nr:hypothetical protein [Oscillatoria sp. FACHB-1407]
MPVVLVYWGCLLGLNSANPIGDGVYSSDYEVWIGALAVMPP